MSLGILYLPIFYTKSNRMISYFMPFKVALGGVIHTFRTQRHMRIHLYITLFTVLGAIILNLRIKDILVVLFMINFTLVAEMFNSAIEATVDLVSPEYHPKAKFAKDIAAGAVLITTIMALTVGVLIGLGEDTWETIRLNLNSKTGGLPFLPKLVLGQFIVFIIMIIGKGLGKRGQIIKGGLVSGHASTGFYLAMSTCFLSDHFLIGAIAFTLAIIIVQCRYEAQIHSIGELALGAFMGVIVSLFLFGMLPQ